MAQWGCPSGPGRSGLARREVLGCHQCQQQPTPHLGRDPNSRIFCFTFFFKIFILKFFKCAEMLAQ